MAGLEAGALDREITLQVVTRTRGRSGEAVESLATLEANVPAEWLSAGTKEQWQSQQRLGAFVDGVYRIYFRDDLTAGNNALIGHDGRVYDIKGVVEDTNMDRGVALLISVVARAD